MDHVSLASLAILTQTPEIKLGNCLARQPATAASHTHPLVFYDDRHTTNRGSEQ